MSKIVRLGFYTLVLILWVGTVALSLEGWMRWRWHQIERKNPFVLSRLQGYLWPIPRIPENDFSAHWTSSDYRDPLRGAGKSITPLPTPSPKDEFLHRFPIFLAQNDFGKHVFGNVYGMDILLVGNNFEVVEAYVAQREQGTNVLLWDYVRENDKTLIRDAMEQMHQSEYDFQFLSSSQPSQYTPFDYCVTNLESGDALCWLIIPREVDWKPQSEETLWELPFFTYRKHAERKDRINALGITEDFYINNYGFRDADLVVPKPAGTFRILCIGASTTEEGPTNDLTYPALLEAIMNRHFGFNRVDVINCGISGMNSLKHRMRVGDYLSLEPDLVVIYNAVNDICHDLFNTWKNSPSKIQRLLRESQFVCRYFGRWLLPPEEQLRRDIQNSKMTNLAFIVSYLRDHGVESAICSFAAPAPEALNRTTRDYYEYYTIKEWTGRYSNFDSYRYVLGLYNEALRQLCEEKGVLYIPVEENMRDGEIIFGDICHLRNPGIEKKASLIAATLIRYLEQVLQK